MLNPNTHLYLNGIRVYLNTSLTTMHYPRRHRSKRIDKKWRKRYGQEIPSPEMIQSNPHRLSYENRTLTTVPPSFFVVHPVTWDKIIKNLRCDSIGDSFKNYYVGRTGEDDCPDDY